MPNPTPKHASVKLTKSYIDRVKPGATDEHHWDAEIKGFGLRVNPSGKMTFVVQGRLDPSKPPARITIGAYGVFTADQARDVAREHCITIAANIAETCILGIEACFPDSIIGFIADPTKANTTFIKYQFDAVMREKMMFVAIDKITAVRMFYLIEAAWKARIKELEAELTKITDDQELVLRGQQLDWMRRTIMAVVVSDEQGEVQKFKDWGLDIVPHRKRMKDGFTVTEMVGGREVEKRLDVETAFKRDNHPFRIVIVCAMWLTGFDVPSLSTLYLDKPLQAHTLMQAIARANRVKEGKNNGLVVDYCGILKNLRKALATFAGHTGQGPIVGGPDGSAIGGTDNPVVDPLNPEEKLLGELAEAIQLVRQALRGKGFGLERLHSATGFEKLKALKDAKEIINVSDETRKRFEVGARAVFRKLNSP